MKRLLTSSIAAAAFALGMSGVASAEPIKNIVLVHGASYTNLAATYAHAGRMVEAKAALAEVRRLNPAITLKWLKEHTPNLPVSFDGLRKAGLPGE